MTTSLKLPHELIRAGAAGSLLVLVGGEANVGSGLPGGKELLERLLVGYGAHDPALLDVLRALRSQGQRPRPFWLAAEGVRGRARAFALGVRPVWLQAGEETAAWLRALGKAIGSERSRGPAIVLAGPDNEAALEKCEQALAEAEQLAAPAPEDTELRRTVMRCQLNVGIGLLNLGRTVQAREALVRLAEAMPLPVSERALLAEGLAQLGEVDRARAALDADNDAEDPSATRALAAARQVIEVMGGRLPEGAALSLVVELHAARLLVRRGRLAEAAARLLQLLLEGRTHALLTLHALDSLAEALEKTIFEAPDIVEPIPISRRGEVVEALDEGLCRLDKSALPAELRGRHELVRSSFHWVTEGHRLHADRRQRIAGAGATEGTSIAHGIGRDHGVLAHAEQLAERGEREAALALLPTSNHPWCRRYERAWLLVEARRLAEALREALDLARQWPERAPIEALAAWLLYLAKRPEALEHARRAFEALPGRAYRWLLGACLLARGDAAEAWEVLELLRNVEEPAVLSIQAQAAEEACTEEAPALWERYLKARPDDAAAWLRVARVEALRGNFDRARELAWTAAISRGNERLPPEGLYIAAQLQRTGGALTDVGRERIRAIVQHFADHFPVQGEPYRAFLLGALDDTAESAPVDIDVIRLHGGILEVHGDETGEIAREVLDEQLAAQRGYLGGLIPFDALPGILQTPAAALFLQAVRGEAFSLSLAARSMDAPVPVLDGARLLAGELELLLIHHLGLWSALRVALGASGKLVIFQEVMGNIADPVKNPVEATARTTAAKEDIAAIEDLAASFRQALETAAREGWVDAGMTRPALAELPELRAELDVPRNRRLIRASIEEALVYWAALEGDAALSLLTADAFTASVAVGRAASLLAWPSLDSVRTFAERMRALDGRLVSLPAIVRRLAPGPEGLPHRLDLAALGFADALDADDLLALVRSHDRADNPELARILDGQERLARSSVARAGREAQLQLASFYAGAIWLAWCSTEALPYDQAQVVTADLLARAERIDMASQTGVVDLVLSVIAQNAAQDPEAAQDPHDATVYPSSISPAGRLWTTLSAWSGPVGSRRASFDRALRQMWLMHDVRSSEDPGASRTATALLLSCHGARHPLDRGVEPVAILSACWETPVLDNVSVMMADARSGEARQAPVEPILHYGAKLLEDGTRTGILWRDAHCRFSFPVSGTPYHVDVVVPTEALLLRTSAAALPSLARELARVQGPNDGRAYELLERIAEQPTNNDVRRAYARFTVAAPWRLVRETPALLASWYAVRRSTLPQLIPDIRAMLSEPPEPIPTDGSLWDMLEGRIAADGIWVRRVDVGVLLSQAALVPGLLPAFLTRHKLSQAEDQYRQLVTEALYRLDHPHDQPAAVLAEAIFFLRNAAGQKPFVRLAEGEIDLRERLPERLVAVLRAVRQAPPTGTLADVEARLLLLSGRIVRRLGGSRHLTCAKGSGSRTGCISGFVHSSIISPRRSALPGSGAFRARSRRWARTTSLIRRALTANEAWITASSPSCARCTTSRRSRWHRMGRRPEACPRRRLSRS